MSFHCRTVGTSDRTYPIAWICIRSHRTSQHCFPLARTHRSKVVSRAEEYARDRLPWYSLRDEAEEVQRYEPDRIVVRRASEGAGRAISKKASSDEGGALLNRTVPRRAYARLIPQPCSTSVVVSTGRFRTTRNKPREGGRSRGWRGKSGHDDRCWWLWSIPITHRQISPHLKVPHEYLCLQCCEISRRCRAHCVGLGGLVREWGRYLSGRPSFLLMFRHRGGLGKLVTPEREGALPCLANLEDQVG